MSIEAMAVTDREKGHSGVPCEVDMSDQAVLVNFVRVVRDKAFASPMRISVHNALHLCIL
jgi:hypothetical protein